MDFKLNLNSSDILNHEFQKAIKGYDALEVDEYLDTIIEDYLNIEQYSLNCVNQLKTATLLLNQEKEKNRQLEIENAKMSSRLEKIGPSESVSSDNLKLIKKINAYEAKLYSLGIDPSKIVK